MSRDFARHPRKTMTDAEQRLWHRLRQRQLGGCRFRRQAPIGPFVVDFVCFERKLVIELDGSQHLQLMEHDTERTAWLESQGFRVLRFWNSVVFEELESVVEAIELQLFPPPKPSPTRGERAGNPPPQPSPTRGERGGNPPPQPSPTRGEGAGRESGACYLISLRS